jgi:hypothetical protein
VHVSSHLKQPCYHEWGRRGSLSVVGLGWLVLYNWRCVVGSTLDLDQAAPEAGRRDVTKGADKASRIPNPGVPVLHT